MSNERFKDCCDLTASVPCADCPRSGSNASLQAQIDELTKALAPFAAFADALSEIVPDNIAIGIFADGAMRFGPSGGADVGSLRNAARALSLSRPQSETPHE